MTTQTEHGTDKKTTRTFTCSSRHVSSFMCFVLILVFTLSLVSDVSSFGFTTHTQFQVQSSFLLDVVVRLCLVIVYSDCSHNSCIFHIAKTGPLRCCPYSALMTFTSANISERRILASNFSVTCSSFGEFHTLDWFLHI